MSTRLKWSELLLKPRCTIELRLSCPLGHMAVHCMGYALQAIWKLAIFYTEFSDIAFPIYDNW